MKQYWFPPEAKLFRHPACPCRHFGRSQVLLSDTDQQRSDEKQLTVMTNREMFKTQVKGNIWIWTVKVPTRVGRSLILTPVPHVFLTSANETISEETGDFCPVCSYAFAWSAQSTETLQNALRHTDQKRRSVVYEHDRPAVLFLTIYGWKQEDIFL